MENDFLKVIETRRSCRKYKPEQITDEELKAVLEAGTYAPTSRGMQSPYIVAVQKKEVLARLAKMNAEIMGVTSNPYYDAPTYVLVFAPSLATNPVQDGRCVLENMMLAAHALRLGSCWIHRARETFDMIIVDTPPIGSVIDAAVMSKFCDGGILVIGAGDVSYKFARKSKEQLDLVGCKILGCVLNKVDMAGNSYYGKYYGKYGEES